MKKAEEKRLKASSKETLSPWKKWGPYISERSWGTVREDYSEDGNAWESFPYDQASYRAYRWGEDGIAGFSDRYQTALLSFAFWNEKDSHIKERFFGLSGPEGNHGEDVKELYYKLDATPTSSYLSFLYKYPISAFPYEKLREENKKRSRKDPEYELIDTGIFEENGYFDVFITYAKNTAEDLFIEVKIVNQSEKKAPFHLFSQLLFRNRWSWKPGQKKPEILGKKGSECLCMELSDHKTKKPKKIPFDYKLGKYWFYGPKEGSMLFTENETNQEKLGKKAQSIYTKDAFHRYVVEKEKNAVNPKQKGTKAAFHYAIDLEAKEEKTFYFRLSNEPLKKPFKKANSCFAKRKKEADDFYENLHGSNLSEEEKLIQRSALSSLIWGQQSYLFDVNVWFNGDDPKNPPPKSREAIRNQRWRHLNSMRIFSMPDKWEYPWFAAWDLSFQSISWALVDMNFAKEQLWLLLFDQFQHPNGQIPAYEWEFSDVNPPVQAWALKKLFFLEKTLHQKEDLAFLETCYHKLLLNFVWWVNKVDTSGKNIFEGGFLGLDNITILDRSLKMERSRIDEADGSGWMAMFCFHLMEIALLLAEKNPSYEGLAIKFFEHYVYIAAALRKGYWRPYDMLNKEDGFFYSVIQKEQGENVPLKIRSLVGIIPFFASQFLEKSYIEKFPKFYSSFSWILENRKPLVTSCIEEVDTKNGSFYFFSLLSQKELPQFLRYLVDEEEFLSPFGLRSLSKYHQKQPFTYQNEILRYEPGESLEDLKGGNSNWRGPVWFPTTYLLLDTLRNLSIMWGDEFSFSFQNEEYTLEKIADIYAERLIKIFQKEGGKKPFLGDSQKLQKDPNFQKYYQFFEYFHAETGKGLGASHQTGWTALIANILFEKNLRMKKL